jgi:hypothetical protein
MPSQSGDSRYHHHLWFIDPEAHAPALMIPTVDLLAAVAGGAGGAGGGGGKNDAMRNGGSGGPTDPLFPSLLIPPNTALGTTQMSAHPATASAVHHRVAWDRKNALALAAATGMASTIGDDGSSGSFGMFLASRPRAVFRSLGAPSPNDKPSNAGGIVGANPMYSSVKEKSNVLVGMRKGSSAAMLAGSGLQDAMFLRGLWVETGMPNPHVKSADE